MCILSLNDGSLEGFPNGTIGNFTNGTIGTNGFINGAIGRTLNDIGVPLVEP